jgi:hypothetical protein
VRDREVRYRLKRDVRYRIVDDEAVVLRQDEAEVLVLNHTGASVLELMGSGASRSALGDAMAARYEVSPSDLERDLSQFLAELGEAGLIEEDESSHAV